MSELSEALEACVAAFPDFRIEVEETADGRQKRWARWTDAGGEPRARAVVLPADADEEECERNDAALVGRCLASLIPSPDEAP